MRPHRPAFALLALCTLLTTSCSAQPEARGARQAAPAVATPPPSTAPSSAPASEGVTMTISSFEYRVPASVRPGAQITVVNQDREAHTVTLDRGAVGLSVLPGATAVLTAPTEVGTHTITCDLHGGMDAALVVA